MEQDQPKMQRLLRLLVLLSGKRLYSSEELANRLDTSTRTIMRYLETFERAGFVVERSNGRYRLLSENAASKAVQQNIYFSEEELYLLHTAISSLAPMTSTTIKLNQKLQTLYNHKALAAIADRSEMAKVAALSSAMNQKLCVVLNKYRSSNSQNISDRLVEPFSFHDNCCGVWCLERSSRQAKLFLLARIGSVEHSREAWQFSELHHLPFTDAFRMSAPKPIAEVTALLSLKASNLLREEYPLAEKHLTKQDNGYLLQIPVAGFQGIGRFLLGLPGESTVLGPGEFLSFLDEKLHKTLYADRS